MLCTQSYPLLLQEQMGVEFDFSTPLLLIHAAHYRRLPLPGI